MTRPLLWGTCNHGSPLCLCAAGVGKARSLSQALTSHQQGRNSLTPLSSCQHGQGLLCFVPQRLLWGPIQSCLAQSCQPFLFTSFRRSVSCSMSDLSGIIHATQRRCSLRFFPPDADIRNWEDGRGLVVLSSHTRLQCPRNMRSPAPWSQPHRPIRQTRLPYLSLRNISWPRTAGD